MLRTESMSNRVTLCDSVNIKNLLMRHLMFPHSSLLLKFPPSPYYFVTFIFLSTIWRHISLPSALHFKLISRYWNHWRMAAMATDPVVMHISLHKGDGFQSALTSVKSVDYSLTCTFSLFYNYKIQWSLFLWQPLLCWLMAFKTLNQL